MNKFQVFVAAVKSLALKASGAKINQVQRNALKAHALKAILEDLAALGAVQTNDGIVIEVANDELGAVHFELDIKVKDLNFDLVDAQAEYAKTLADRDARAAAAAEKKVRAEADRKAKAEAKAKAE